MSSNRELDNPHISLERRELLEEEELLLDALADVQYKLNRGDGLA
ncbi:hypothetical protein SEA_NICEHOUSE_257 [Rhodococcus phage NiceHouse]|nr:hypothetical protein SEA_NICEHOUSE_257 [Rhodococcus phage NiceHouse]